MNHSHSAGYSLLSFLTYTICTSVLLSGILSFFLFYMKQFSKIENLILDHAKTTHCISRIQNLTAKPSLTSLTETLWYKNIENLSPHMRTQISRLTKTEDVDVASAIAVFFDIGTPTLFEKKEGYQVETQYFRILPNQKGFFNTNTNSYLMVTPWNRLLIKDNKRNLTATNINFSADAYTLFSVDTAATDISFNAYRIAIEIKNAGFIFKDMNNEIKVFSFTEDQHGTLCKNIDFFEHHNHICYIRIRSPSAQSDKKAFPCPQTFTNPYERQESIEKWIK